MLASLRRVASIVASGTAPAEVFATIASEAGHVIGLPLVALWRYEPEARATVIGAWSERTHPFHVGTCWPLDGPTICTQVKATGQRARIEDYADVPGTIAAAARASGIRSCVGAPIIVDGDLWGAMSMDSTGRALLPDHIEDRLATFTDLVAIAISDVQARSELALSRARIAAAVESERQRVVRDLHDGAQQRLVQTVVTLKLACQALQADEEAAPELVAEALAQAESATVELRQLARGILPSELMRGGLRGGVQALASRMPLPVRNGVAVGRLPAVVEATAYFVVAEALTNIVKHSRAGCAVITARVEGRVLRVRVSDDGVGGAQPNGTGLLGLADRVALLDGRLDVWSPPQRGTLVAADIPLRHRC
jgi:signal transduction histidine kinase